MPTCSVALGASRDRRRLDGSGEGRRLSSDVVEQVLFALVANRCLEPGSKLAATHWAEERVALLGCPAFDDDAAYAAMDFLLDALPEIAKGIFDRTATLLNLSCDVIFVDTSSTYFERDVPDPLVELDTAAGEAEARGEVAEDHGPEEAATRRFSKHSKDHRPDLPQVVLGMAVTAEGIPIRCWTFPGTTSDQAIIKTIKDDLAGWMLNRVVWVADSGFNSENNRAYLQRGGGHYIVAERVRGGSKEAKAALARAGRYHHVAGNLEVKEVRLGDGARSQRFVVCHNPEVAARDRQVRENLVAISRKDRWFGWLVQATPRRARRRAAHDAGTPSPRSPDQGRTAPHRQGRHRQRGALRRQVLAPHLRRHAHAHRPRPRLQAALRGRTGMARLEGGARAATDLPLPRGPHPCTCPAVLAGVAAHPHGRARDRRHLAQRAQRARPDAPRHARDRRGSRRPALDDDPSPTRDLPGSGDRRAGPLLRLRASRALRVVPAHGVA